MKKTKKLSKKGKIVIALICCGAAVLAAGAALFSKTKQNRAAYVAPVEELNCSWVLENGSNEGVISDMAKQEVLLDATGEVEQVLVEEGQTVARGDVLLTYDVEQLKGELEVARLTKAAKEDQLALAQKKLENSRNLPVRTAEESNAAAARIEELSNQADLLEARIEELSAMEQELSQQTPSAALGEENNPQPETEGVNPKPTEDGTALQQEAEGANPKPAEDGTALQQEADAGQLAAEKKECLEKRTAVLAELENLLADTTQYYTQEEKNSMIAAQELEIRRMQNSIRSSELDIARVQRQMEDTKVTAAMDGIVSHVGDDTQIRDGSPFLTVVALSGLSVIGYVDEYTLDTVHVGDEITVTSWESGSSTAAVIGEISPYPATDYQSYQYGNSNFSYYAFTAYLKDAEGFAAEEWVSVQMESPESAIVLERIYVDEDEEGDFVLVDDGSGKLKRQAVEIREVSEAEYVQITEGLAQEDLLAFPHGKSGFAGNVTTTEQSFSPLSFF